jgi:hypothetical protein
VEQERHADPDDQLDREGKGRVIERVEDGAMKPLLGEQLRVIVEADPDGRTRRREVPVVQGEVQRVEDRREEQDEEDREGGSGVQERDAPIDPRRKPRRPAVGAARRAASRE